MDKIDQIVSNQQYPDNELIAMGEQMVPGIDGELEYLFSTHTGGRPRDVGLHVDHYDLNLVHNVEAGQLLVRKIPAQPGEQGMSVHGQPLKAPRVKDVRLPVGKGTAISEKNPLELVATSDGFVRLDTHSFDRVVVEGVFQVGRDVDLSTGNLDIDGSVSVLGSIREGFSVKATGSVEVSGIMEAGTIEAGGSVQIKGGVIGGKKKAYITAKSEISVKFADNAVMNSGSTITVADEAINCDLQADKSVLVVGQGHGKSAGAIVGGLVTAGQEIRAISVGTDAGILTRLRVGEQPGLIERRRNMQADIKTHKEKLKELKEMLISLQKRQEERMQAKEQRVQQLGQMEKRQSELYTQMRTILSEAEKEGLVTSAATIETLETEIHDTRNTLHRIEDSIKTLKQRIESETATLSEKMKNRKTLEQFQAARENMISKLTDFETQLTQRTTNPWEKLPWGTRRELEQIQSQLQSVQGHLASIEAENATDQKLQDAVSQLAKEYKTIQTDLEVLEANLETVNQNIENSAAQTPRIIVSEKLWSGTEVIISKRRRRFTKNRTGVKVQLSENEAIIALNLA
jgi:uncharacterized protein (DUF342 family)